MPYRVACPAIVAFALALATSAASGDEPGTISVKVRVAKMDQSNKRVCLEEANGEQSWYEINPEKNKKLEIDGKPAYFFNLKTDMTGVLLLPRDPKAKGFTLSVSSVAAKAVPTLPPGANATLIDKNGKMYPIWVPNGTPSTTYGLNAYVPPSNPYWGGGQSPNVSMSGYAGPLPNVSTPGSAAPPQQFALFTPSPFGARRSNYSGIGYGAGQVARPWTEDRALEAIFAALVAHVGKVAAENSDSLFIQVIGGGFATLIRDNQIEAALRAYLPQLPGGAVRFVRRLITSALDGESSVLWFGAVTAKEEIVEHLKKDYPGLEGNVLLVELLVKVAQRAR